MTPEDADVLRWCHDPKHGAPCSLPCFACHDTCDPAWWSISEHVVAKSLAESGVIAEQQREALGL